MLSIHKLCFASCFHLDRRAEINRLDPNAPLGWISWRSCTRVFPSFQLLGINPQTDHDSLNLWSGLDQEIGRRKRNSFILSLFSLVFKFQISNSPQASTHTGIRKWLLRLNRSTPRDRREDSKCRNTQEGNQ